MRLCQSRGQWALAWSMIGLFPPSAATGCMPTVSLLLPKLRRTQCCSSPFFLFSFGEWCRRWHRAFVGAPKDCCTKNRRPTSPTKTKETPSSHKTEWCGSSHPVSGCDRSTPTTSMDRTSWNVTTGSTCLVLVQHAFPTPVPHSHPKSTHRTLRWTGPWTKRRFGIDSSVSRSYGPAAVAACVDAKGGPSLQPPCDCVETVEM